AVDLKPHGDGGGVPAAGRQAAKETVLRRFRVGVEGLRIIIARESLDRFGGHGRRAGDETLADKNIFQIKTLAHPLPPLGSGMKCPSGGRVQPLRARKAPATFAILRPWKRATSSSSAVGPDGGLPEITLGP